MIDNQWIVVRMSKSNNFLSKIHATTKRHRLPVLWLIITQLSHTLSSPNSTVQLILIVNMICSEFN